MSKTIKAFIQKLQNSDDAIDVKVGYMAGDYELEESILECLDVLSNSISVENDRFLKIEAIQHFLHDY